MSLGSRQSKRRSRHKLWFYRLSRFARDAKWAHHSVGALATVHTSDEGVEVSAFATQPIASSTAWSVAFDLSPSATEEM